MLTSELPQCLIFFIDMISLVNYCYWHDFYEPFLFSWFYYGHFPLIQLISILIWFLWFILISILTWFFCTIWLLYWHDFYVHFNFYIDMIFVLHSYFYIGITFMANSDSENSWFIYCSKFLYTFRFLHWYDFCATFWFLYW